MQEDQKRAGHKNMPLTFFPKWGVMVEQALKELITFL